MASLGNPRTWVPYMNSKDCSQGFCSLYCPQWCYIVYPPPPPFEFPEDNHSSTNFSPLVIAIIGILASAFLLVSYYTLISKFCGNRDSTRRESHDANEGMDENHNPSLHEPWHVSTTGLDEALIKSITVCKYKKGDGLVEFTDCSVCLSEFLEDENVKLLPKCSHAFHVPCIDKWLKSHSNCPLCRASLFTFNPSAVQVPASVIEIPSRSNEAFQEIQDNNENAIIIGRENELSLVEEEEMARSLEVGKPSLRAFSDLGNLQERHSIIEIRDEGYESIRRSISMDHSFQGQSSVSHVLNINEEGSNTEAGPSKRFRGESSSSSSSKCGCKRTVLHCVPSPISMKRSFSSGRLSLSRNGRGRLGITIPV